MGNIFKRLNIKSRTNREKSLKYSCDTTFFERIDTEEKAYWLGFIYADGYLIQKTKGTNCKLGISISTIDEEHLYKFKDAISSNHPIKVYKVTSGYNTDSEYCRINISEPKMVQDLISLGVSFNKTNILKYPDCSQVPHQLQHHFIRGFLDGDGSIIQKNIKGKVVPHVSFCGTSEMLEGLMDYFKIRVRITTRWKERDNNNFDIRFCRKNDVKNILEVLYKNSKVYLNRKYELFLLADI